MSFRDKNYYRQSRREDFRKAVAEDDLDAMRQIVRTRPPPPEKEHKLYKSGHKAQAQ